MKSKNLLHLYTKDNYIHTQNRHVNYIINFSQKKKKTTSSTFFNKCEKNNKSRYRKYLYVQVNEN